MPQSPTALKNLLDSWPSQHPVGPRLDMRPVLDVYAKEPEHPGHRKRKIREVSQRRPVLERNVFLSRLAKALFENVPLLERVGMKPARCRVGQTSPFFFLSIFFSFFFLYRTNSLVKGPRQLYRILSIGITTQEVQPVLGSRAGKRQSATLPGWYQSRMGRGKALWRL